MNFRFLIFNFRINLINIFLLLFTIITIGENTASAKPVLTGKVLAQRVFDRENGDDVSAGMKMTLVNKRGRQNNRAFKFYSKDYGDLIKQLNRFNSPDDIKGTGFLSVEKGEGKTEQFLYLPSQGRTRRIVSSQKSRAYVNSDFSYEDMERRQVEDFDHQISGEETIANIDCYILESKPKDTVETQYGRIKNWIDPLRLIPLYVEYFDQKDRMIKKYRVVRLKKIQNIWTEMEVVMENLKRKHKTRLTIDSIVYNTGIADRLFTRQYLESF